MKHDSMCPVNQYIGFPDPFGLASRAECRCALIAKAREYERATVTAEFMSNHGDRWEYEQGQRDMLAKCIAALDEPDVWIGGRKAAVAALRALLDNQDNI